MSQPASQPEPLPAIEPPGGRFAQVAAGVVTCLVIALLLALACAAIWLWGAAVATPSEPEVYGQALKLLEAGKFAETRAYLQEASTEGAVSARLINLDAQALRRIPGENAFQHAATLPDFGYAIGSQGVRDPTAIAYSDNLAEALSLLRAAGRERRDVLLNRAHAELAANEPLAARSTLVEANRLGFRSPDAYLGRGIAFYMQGDLQQSIQSSGQCLQLQPDQYAGRVNLAMALEELGALEDAITMWQSALRHDPPEPLRKQIEGHLAKLNAAPDVPESQEPPPGNEG